MAHLINSAKKSLGQHFLHDGNVLRKIVNAAKVDENDHILEIGPGKGHLTKKLLLKGCSVTAIELDHDLVIGPLTDIASNPKLEIVEGDARTVDLKNYIANTTQFKLVANLPYNAGTNILRSMLLSDVPPQLSVVMLQKEVARNITATRGKSNILSSFFQAYYHTNFHFNVQPRSFTPQPKVMSGVISLERKESPLLPKCLHHDYFLFLTCGFAAPRKQLHNSLSQGLKISIPEVKDVSSQLGLNSELRPAALSVEEWVAVFKKFHGKKYNPKLQ